MTESAVNVAVPTRTQQTVERGAEIC
ncbi:uncharacterized protein G2W53_025119 [Senna tora]|uniref:Uncharacterized protein n=1 Tax=Senna tora TaxID=362788 RepID=A0A834WJZ6_9FABA|nr:uncharacterized protein G2W53_025119 [Senna tora]